MITVDDFLAQPVPKNMTKYKLATLLQVVYGQSFIQYMDEQSGVTEAVRGNRFIFDSGVST